MTDIDKILKNIVKNLDADRVTQESRNDNIFSSSKYIIEQNKEFNKEQKISPETDNIEQWRKNMAQLSLSNMNNNWPSIQEDSNNHNCNQHSSHVQTTQTDNNEFNQIVFKIISVFFETAAGKNILNNAIQECITENKILEQAIVVSLKDILVQKLK